MVSVTAPARRRVLLRFIAPVALLAAVTLTVLLVRQTLETTKAPPSAVKVGAVAEPKQAPPARPDRKRFYVIRSGDTLGAVAERFDTTVARLLRLNDGLVPTALRIGQKIRIS